jgi:3-hydroxy-9,10-secoandrosta-1,3,5(10)-triene-9,17-dione monooxygenase reductase component
MPDPPADIDGDQFRRVMAHVPTSVAVVAAVADTRPRGLSVGTLVPVSLSPPLIGFFIATTSKTWPEIERSGSFCVSVLGEDQARISSRFALSEIDKFEGVSWTPAPSGNPVLVGAVAWVDCDLERVVATGDHMLVLGAVKDMGVGTGQTPLVHHRSGYHSVADALANAETAADVP